MDRVENINGFPLWDTTLRTNINNFEPTINDKADKDHKHDEYLTKAEATNKYATFTYLTTEINEIIGLIENIDLTPLVTKNELENKKYLTKIPDEYVTESELNNMGFLTEQQDVSTYATITYIDAEIAVLKKWVEDNYAKKTELDAIRTRLENLEIEINKLKQDLEDMKADVDGLDIIVGYSITYTLTSVASSNSETYAKQNTSYSTKLSCVSNYDFSTVKVTMGGTDITNSVVTTSGTDERTINISNVTGNIVITAVAKEVIEKVYTITYNLSGAASSNQTTSITGENNSYNTSITPNDGLTLDTIKVTMGGTDITSSVVTDTSEEIVFEQGGIDINGSIDNVYTDCVRSNYVYIHGLSSVSISLDAYTGDMLQLGIIAIYDNNKNFIREIDARYMGIYSFTPETSDYYMIFEVTSGQNGILNPGVTNTEGVVTVTPSKAKDERTINISNVTGDIVITATAKNSSSGTTGTSNVSIIHNSAVDEDGTFYSADMYARSNMIDVSNYSSVTINVSISYTPFYYEIVNIALYDSSKKLLNMEFLGDQGETSYTTNLSSNVAYIAFDMFVDDDDDPNITATMEYIYR